MNAVRSTVLALTLGLVACGPETVAPAPESAADASVAPTAAPDVSVPPTHETAPATPAAPDEATPSGVVGTRLCQEELERTHCPQAECYCRFDHPVGDGQGAFRRAVVLATAPRLGRLELAADAPVRCAGGSVLLVLRAAGWSRVDEPLGRTCWDAKGAFSASGVDDLTISAAGASPAAMLTLTTLAKERDGDHLQAVASMTRTCSLEADRLVCREGEVTFDAVTAVPPPAAPEAWENLYARSPLRHPPGTVGEAYFQRMWESSDPAGDPLLLHPDGRVATTWTHAEFEGTWEFLLSADAKGKVTSKEVQAIPDWRSSLAGFAPVASIVRGVGEMPLSDDGYHPLAALGAPLDRWLVLATTTKNTADIDLVPPENDRAYRLGKIRCTWRSCRDLRAEVAQVAVIGADRVAVTVTWVSGGRMADEDRETALGVFALPREAVVRLGALAPPEPGPRLGDIGPGGPGEPTGADRQRFCDELLALPEDVGCTPETCWCSYQHPTVVGGALEAGVVARVDDRSGPRFNDEGKFSNASVLLLKPAGGAWQKLELGRTEVGMHASPTTSHELGRVEAVTLVGGPVLWVESTSGFDDETAEHLRATVVMLWTVRDGKLSSVSLTTAYERRATVDDDPEKWTRVKWSQSVSVADGKVVVAAPSKAGQKTVKPGRYTLDELRAQANVESGTLEPSEDTME